MDDVGFHEGDGDVAVGVCGPEIFQADRGAVETELVAAGKHFARNPAGSERKEIVVPVFDALNAEEVLPGVRVR
ncbi:hypothetical protein F07S3_77040 [Bradyrhizobium diazoefficiens]|uniref:Uncharacterized protein n=1 Tax=Bradyrhizobium diazoefficiens TaxID=1355477 RepID=A0A810AYF9_9BRAD|nr:hypothetical protein F07S3_77040 [Bradyrhizobium diazoefficiens]BCA15555.1 hypothetical protein BDHF08_74020 [Bradyrhizobium diazoefficiens]BCE68651.1 hypothetical protein XF6B_74500 [Bradyrhizobium diazoefficiens]